MSNKHSLYQCLEAKVRGDRILCAKGHSFSASAKGGKTIPVLKLMRGDPLELTVCQDCHDYKEMGPPVPWQEMGWAHLIEE